jgi:hypothetical protein
MKLPELIGLLELAQEGRQLQMLIDGEWKNFDAENWVRNFTQFRASPEPRKPREWWVIDEGEYAIGCPSPDATRERYFSGNRKLIRVREVIECNS